MPAPAQAAVGRGDLVPRQAEAPTVPCPCGQSTRLRTRTDGPMANFHVTFITDSIKHLGLPIGRAAGFCGSTFVDAKGTSYRTNDPQACANYHVLQEQ